MKIDVCLPVYRNLTALEVALRGLAKFSANIGKLCLFFQDPNEAAVFQKDSFPDQAHCVGYGPENMSDILNRLCAMGDSEWILFMEQDTFLLCDLPKLVESLQENQIVVAGPLDTLFYGHPNAKLQPHYGKYGRLSPEPGFFHQSFILLKRLAATPNPFTIPVGYKMHGTGVLGGESYYGLRINLEKALAVAQMAFFEQQHFSYGYSALIGWDEEPIAVHLYYSSTKEGYRASGFISESEYQWLKSEEERFLHDYVTEENNL